MNNIEELKNLNKLNGGIKKHWIWGDEINYSLSCNYLQKVNYSIQDLNSEICNLSTPTMKEVIYVIVLIDWICEAVDSIHKILREEVISFLHLSKDAEIQRADSYLKAIRSFIVAHPLNTNRHKKFGMDGDLICIDVRNKIPAITEAFSNPNDWFSLNFDGWHEKAKSDSSDFILCVYSHKKDKMKSLQYVRANFTDLYSVVRLQLDRLYSLDAKLSKLTKKKVDLTNE